MNYGLLGMFIVPICISLYCLYLIFHRMFRTEDIDLSDKGISTIAEWRDYYKYPEPMQYTSITTTTRKRCGRRQQYIPRYLRGRK